MVKTRYGQKPLKHAKKGVQSCVLAGVVLFLLLVMLSASWLAKGEVGVTIGAAGLLVLFLAIHGLRSGLKGFKERDKDYITCRAGTAINAAVLAGMVLLYIRGLL